MARFENPAAVPIAMPSTSPVAHPERQCSVALNATRFRFPSMPTEYTL